MTENRFDRKLKVIYSLSGREEKARSEAGQVLRIYPKFSLNRYEKRVSCQNEAPRSKLRGLKADTDRYIGALRKADLK